MCRWSTLPRSLRLVLATVLGAASVLYGCVWMYAVRHQSAPVELGFDPQYIASEQVLQVLSVSKGSPAERAGLRVNDRIVAVDGRRLETIAPLEEAWARGRPGDSVELSLCAPAFQRCLSCTASSEPGPNPRKKGLRRRPRSK